MKMQNAEMEFVTFDTQDVIATSGGTIVNFANIGDNTSHNLLVTMAGEANPIFNWATFEERTGTTSAANAIIAALNEKMDGALDGKEYWTLRFGANGSEYGLSALISYDHNDSGNSSELNGSYKWNGSIFEQIIQRTD